MPGFDIANMRVGKRKLTIQHLTEAMQDMLPAAAANTVSSTTDRGKPVTFSGSSMDLCADGDEMVGFIEAVNTMHSDGRVPVGIRDRGHVLALDEAGSLSVGDTVVSGTQTAYGTHPIASSGTALAGQNPAGRVKLGAPTVHIWVVWEVYGTGADRPVLLRKT